MSTVLIGVLILFTCFISWMLFYRKKQLKKRKLRIIGLFLLTAFYISSVDFVFNNVFQKHHQDRFNILLGKTDDIRDIGYNANQSVITIASGGLTGKGFLQGEKTKGDFVPEQQTDYIFTTVGEEWGFIGTTLVVVLFVLFLLRIIRNAERQKSKFSRVYGYGIAALFFTHFAINIGMVLGILPTIGIPLPFFSYGGSSLWGYTILLFIFVRLDANRKYEW
jgi:rod shape determining protein RodA